MAGYCWSLTDSRESAADLAQEAFARLLARWASVREPRAYLFRTAANLARQEWRHRRAAPIPEQELFADDGTDLLAVRQAVWSLPRGHRDAVWLHYFTDLSVGEIAKVLIRGEGTVKWLLADARRRLMGTLDGNDE